MKRSEREARDARLCAAFRRGLTIPRLAEQFGLSVGGVARVLKASGLKASDGGRARRARA